MRALVLCMMLLAGCAAPPKVEMKVEPRPAPVARDCPPLPSVPARASHAALLEIIAIQARLYVQCAGGD